MSVLPARPASVPLAALLINLALIAPCAALAQNAPAAPAPPSSGVKTTPVSSGAKAAATPAAPPVTPQVRLAIAQFQTAARLSTAGKRAEGIKAFQQFITLAQAAKMGTGALLPAYQNIYRLQQQRGDVKGMEATLQQIAKLDPQNALVYVQLATLYLSLHRFEEASASADRALQYKPVPIVAAQAHFARGAWAYARKEWTSAEAEYQQSARLAPGNPQALYNLLLVQNEQHKIKPALATAAALLKIEPHNTPARLITAALKQQDHDASGALAAYKDVLRYEPRNTVALFNQALLYQQTGRPDDAITAYTAFTAVAPREFSGHYNLGLLYAGIHNPLAARAQFEAAAQIKSADAHAFLQLALAERDLGFGSPDAQRVSFLRASEQHFIKSLALDPANTQTENLLAALYERDNRYDQALALYRRRQQADPDNPENYARIAHADLALRQPDAAIAEWRKYRTRKPGDPVSYGEIADLLEAQGKWPDAQQERTEQIQRDPKNGAPHLALARDDRELKQTGEAEAQYKLLLDMDVSAKDAGEKERPYIAAARRNWRVKAWRGLSEIADTSGKTEDAAAYLDNIQQDELAQAKRGQKLPDAQIYVDTAALRERAKQPELARATLQTLTHERPDDAEAFTALGDFEARQGHIEDAALAYRRAAERAADPVAYGLKAALLYQTHNLPDKAIAELTRLLAKTPQDARLSAPLAQSLELVHDDSRALVIYDTLLKSAPNDALLLDKKAVVLTRLKRYADALRIRERLAERTPQDYQAYANIGYLYAQQNKSDAYLRWLATRIEKTPDVLPVLAAYMDASVQQKHEDEGWQTLRRLVQKHPLNPDVQEAYIAILQQHNRNDDVLALRRQIARAAPLDVEAQTRLNDALLASDKTDEADTLLAAFVQSTGVSRNARFQAQALLARQLAAHHKTEPAIAQYRQILQSYPRDLASTLALGALYVTAGRDQAALTLYVACGSDAKTPAPLRAHFLTLVGDVYARQGLTPQAQAQYKEALRLNPQSREATQALERLPQIKSASGK